MIYQESKNGFFIICHHSSIADRFSGARTSNSFLTRKSFKNAAEKLANESFWSECVNQIWDLKNDKHLCLHSYVF